MQDKSDLGKSPAFPLFNLNTSHAEEGMDLRTYIATQAMKSILGNSNFDVPKEGSMERWNYETISILSVKAADALIAELSKNT